MCALSRKKLTIRAKHNLRRNLLKWRTKILNIFKTRSEKLEDNTISSNFTESEKIANEDKEDLEVETEVQRLLDVEEKLKKKKMKKVRKVKRKLAERYVLKMSHESDYIEQNDDELFSLAAVKDLVGLEESNRLSGDTSNTGIDDLAREQIDAALKAKRQRLAYERLSAVEGRKRVHFERRIGDHSDEQLTDDELFGGSYAHNQRDDLCISSEESSDNESDEKNDAGKSTLWLKDKSSEIDRHTNSIKISSSKSRSNDKKNKSKREMILPPGLALSTFEQEKRNPLLVDLDDSEEIVKKKRKIDSWFGSDEIQEILAPPREDDNDTSTVISTENFESNHSSNSGTRKVKQQNKTLKKDKNVSIQSDPESPSFEIQIPKVPPAELEKSLHRIRRLNRPLTAEERAVATRLIHSAKSRRELLESGYNRYQFFEKSSDLPDWFVEDEKKHMRKPITVKKEEIPIDVPTMGRSLSKAEQAKARKKARLAKRLKRIRQKAESISDEIPETEKWQQIKQMYKKAGLLKKKRRPLHLIVNTKAGSRSGGTKPQKGAKVKIVDKRMKADLRGQQKAKDRKKPGKRKNKVGRPGRPKSRGLGKRR